jgi:hypothetical protein
VTSWFAGVVTNTFMIETEVVFFRPLLDVIFPGGGASGYMPKLHLEFLANQFAFNPCGSVLRTPRELAASYHSQVISYCSITVICSPVSSIGCQTFVVKSYVKFLCYVHDL